MFSNLVITKRSLKNDWKIALDIKTLGEMEDFVDALFSNTFSSLKKTNVKGLWNWGYFDDDMRWNFSIKSDDIGDIVLHVADFYKGNFHPNERVMWHDQKMRFFIVNTIIMKIAKNLYIKENE